MDTLQTALEAEFYNAARHLGASWDILFRIKSGEGLHQAFKDLGASDDLLAIVGGYGNTLSDEDVLAFLRQYNAGRAASPNIICRTGDAR